MRGLAKVEGNLPKRQMNMKTSTTIVSIRDAHSQTRRVFDHQETAARARVPVRTLLKYWNFGLIEPRNDCQRYGIFFDEEAVYRIRKAESIRESLQTNIHSASIVFSLSEEISHLRQELRFLRDAR